MELNREDMLRRLEMLDEDVSALMDDDDDRTFHMVIVGGGALVLLETITRSTHDIDVLSASKEIVRFFQKYDMNCDVMAHMDNFAYNYEDRLVRLPIQGERIHFFTASLEDIVVAKLFSNRDTDRQDILSRKVLDNLDWDVMDHIAYDEDEAKASAMNERCYVEFLENYAEYKRRYGP